jgi:hypothetical protein
VRDGPDGLGFELIRKRDQPSLYFDATGNKCNTKGMGSGVSALPSFV